MDFSRFISHVFQAFRSTPYSVFIIALGWSVVLVAAWLMQVDLSVTDFSGRIISTATASNIDVSARTYTFVLAIIGLVLGTMIFGWIGGFLRSVASTAEWMWLMTSLGGIFFFTSLQFLLSSTIQEPNILTFTIITVTALHIFSALILCARYVFPQWTLKEQGSDNLWRLVVSAFFISSTIFVTLLCIITDIPTEFALISSVFFTSTSFFFVGILIFSLTLLISLSTFFPTILQRVYVASRALFGVWLTPFFAIELTQFLFVRAHIDLHSHKYLYIFFVCIQVSLFIFFFFRDTPSRQAEYLQRLNAWVYPVLIVGLTTAAMYQPQLAILADFFEPANSGLMIQQWHDFAVIPWLQNFNAHGFSDAFFGFIFTGLFGLQKANWQYYDFIGRIIELLIAYFFLVKVTGNRHVSGGIILLLPALGVVFPQSFTILLAMPLALYMALNHASTASLKNKIMRATLLMIFTVCFVAWRIDIGVSAIVTTIAVLAVYAYTLHSHAFRSIKIFAIPLLYGVLITSTIFFIAISFVAFIGDVHIVQLFIDLSHILKSDQTFGYSTIVNAQTAPEWVWFYYGVMTCVCIAAGFLVLKEMVSEKVQNIRDLHAHIPMLFLVGISLITTARGLVRHSLVENEISLIYPFAPIILLWLVWRGGQHFLEKRYQDGTFLVIGVVVMLPFYSWLLPVTVTPDTAIDLALRSVSATQNALKYTPPVLAENRSQIPPVVQDQYRELETFIHKNLEPQQTFFDLSTSPMLYYVLHKKLPIYTNHHMLMHDEYLQERTIEQLKEHDVPVVIFRAQGKDVYNLDGVPFQYRYFRLTEYIYSEYVPYARMSGREIWVKRGFSVTHPAKELIRTPESSAQYILGSTPALWGQKDLFFTSHADIDTRIELAASTSTKESLPLRQRFQISSVEKNTRIGGQYIVVTLNTKESSSIQPSSVIALTLGAGDSEITRFQARRLLTEENGVEKYAFRVSAFLEWSVFQPEWLTIDANTPVSIQSISLVHEPYAVQ